jgi:hypothetical protein
VNLQLAPLPIEEPPAAADDVARMLADAMIADEASLIDAIQARRVEVGISLAELDRLSGLAFGHASKCLSPARAKSPTMKTLQALLDSLALSIVLVIDNAKAARVSPSWQPRDASKVRQRPLSPAVIARAKPHVIAALARQATRPRWANVPARDFMRAMAREEIA